MQNAICLNSNTYHGYALSHAVEGARRAGINFLEISAVRGHTEHVHSGMSDVEIAAVLELLRGNNIEVLAMGGHSNLMTDEGREQFRENLQLAARLGARYIVTGTGETHDDNDVIEDDAELVAVLRELVSEAVALGLVIALETHGNNYGTGEQISRLVSQLGAENFGINYDTANVIFYGDIEPYDDLENNASNVVGIHLKDKAGTSAEWNFPAIGDGDIDFDRLFGILSRTSCTAPLSIEIEFTPQGPASVDEVHDAVARSAAVVGALAPLHP